MRVAIDAGNTRIKWGLHDGQHWTVRGQLLTGDAAQLADIAAEWPTWRQAAACCVAGSVVEREIERALVGRGRTFRWVRAEAAAHGVRNGYSVPETLGADRWSALLGARALVASACVVVCAGTATTVDWLDDDGQFRGGLILPGLNMMRAALAGNTAQLPYADGDYRAAPRSTRDAILSGCLDAQAGAVERLAARVAEAANGGSVACLLTGGDAQRIAACLTIPCRVEETLILDGVLAYA